MGKRKELYFGTRSGNGAPRIRMSVSDRSSKAARPWNHPEVVKASEAYGVNLLAISRYIPMKIFCKIKDL